jgi:hypothetical protein
VYRPVRSFAVPIGAGTLDRAMTAAAESPRASAEPPAYPVLRHRSAPPPANPPLGDDLRAFVESHPRLFVLTGAGCSTDSGIPDYRDATGAWKRSSPVEYVPFMRDPLTRSRYWARSLIGWRSFGVAAPNAAHHALAALERLGHVRLLVTQNVDGLHQAAGSRRVVDLHGRLDAVVCTTCRHVTGRDEWQHELAALNRPTSRHSGYPTAGTAVAWSSPTWCSSARACLANAMYARQRRCPHATRCSSPGRA